MKMFIAIAVTLLMSASCFASGYSLPFVVSQPVVQPVVQVHAAPIVVQPMAIVQPLAIAPVAAVPVHVRTVHFTRYPLRGGPRGILGIRGRVRDRAYIDMAARSHAYTAAVQAAAIRFVPLVLPPAEQPATREADDGDTNRGDY